MKERKRRGVRNLSILLRESSFPPPLNIPIALDVRPTSLVARPIFEHEGQESVVVFRSVAPREAGGAPPRPPRHAPAQPRGTSFRPPKARFRPTQGPAPPLLPSYSTTTVVALGCRFPERRGRPRRQMSTPRSHGFRAEKALVRIALRFLFGLAHQSEILFR